MLPGLKGRRGLLSWPVNIYNINIVILLLIKIKIKVC
jgi:hypothetical protein